MNGKETVKKLNDAHLIDDLKYRLILEGILVGLITGVIVSLFRLILSKIESYRMDAIGFFSSSVLLKIAGILVIVILVYVSAFISKKEPLVAGSGIPQVKGEALGKIKSKWYSVLVYKFIGSITSIASGLSLGREGPSIQLGAMIGKGVSRLTGRLKREETYLLLCGAGAGLAAAFNAPFAGVLFVLEEVRRKFSHKAFLTTMAGAITSDWVASKIFGLAPVFNIILHTDVSLKYFWAFAILGIICGLIAVLYIKLVNGIKKVLQPLKDKKLLWPLTILVLVVLTIYYPIGLGSGHNLIELVSDSSNVGLKYVLILLLVKFIASIYSFGTGVSGGTMQPILVLGGLVGSAFGLLCSLFFGLSAELVPYFVVLGMGGLFTGIVKTPITSIMLIIELTSMKLNMLALAIPVLLAYVVADVLRTRPLYDMLLDNIMKETIDVKRF